MGAFMCEFNVVHKMCRCPKSHTIKCDKPLEHSLNTLCLVMQDRLAGITPAPKHSKPHEPHYWWFTTYNGGHQLDEEPNVGDPDYWRVTKHFCQGWDYGNDA